ncbi:TPA: hypothetical protein JZ977_001683 [Escherichia coli]|nr:hypothetical protein [Escherichia coli]
MYDDQLRKAQLLAGRQYHLQLPSEAFRQAKWLLLRVYCMCYLLPGAKEKRPALPAHVEPVCVLCGDFWRYRQPDM